MFAKNHFRRLFVLSIAVQLMVGCQPKVRDKKNKITPPKQEQTEQTEQTAQVQDQTKGAISDSPSSNQSVSQVIGSAQEKTEGQQQKDSDTKDKKPVVTVNPANPQNPKAEQASNNSVQNQATKPKENKNLFMRIAVDASKCQSTGIQLIRFQDNEKTTLVISQLIPNSGENEKAQLSVIKINDKKQIQSVVVSDAEKSTENSLLLLDARLNIDGSHPNEVRLAISGQQNELVGQVIQLSKDDEISKQICNKIELNPLSVVLQTEVLKFNEKTKNKKIEFAGAITSQDQIISEVKIQLLKEFKAIIQIANWTQQFDFTFTESDNSLIQISGFGNILVVNNHFELKLSKGINIRKDSIPKIGNPSLVESKAKDNSQLIIQEGQKSELTLKYAE